MTHRDLAVRGAEAALEALPAGVVVLDSECRVVSANRRALELFGRSVGSALDWPSDALRSALAGAAASETRELAGAPYEISVTPLRDREVVAGATLTAWPLADKSRADRFRAALDAARLVTWEWNVADDESRRDEGRDFGPRASTADEFIALLHPADRPSVATAMQRSLREGAPYEIRYRKLVDGEWRRFEATAELVRDADGKIVRLVGSAMDVTEREKLEEQLQRAQKMEAIGRLAGGVAHDFNNILTALASLSHLLRHRHADDSESVEDLDVMLGAIQRATGVTKQLLALTKQGGAELGQADLGVVVREVEQMVRRMLGDGVSTTLDLAPVPLFARADAGQIHQVLLNLVMNAKDAMPSGGHLTISTARIEVADGKTGEVGALRPGPYAVVEVRDTGIGMDQETRERIFEPFFSTKPPNQGTGLGLSTAWAIVARHGGRIALDSEQGEGTRMRVYLPIVEDEPRAKVVAPKAVEEPMPPAVILLVEDDDAVRNVARRVLALRNYRVVEAANGKVALEIFDRGEHSFDLVLTDVVMPIVGGMALAKALEERAPGLPVVFTSGYTDDDVLRHGLTTREVMFLRKPYMPEALLAIVDAALKSRLPSPV